MSKGVLGNKEREMIAIGVSVVAKCQPCLQYHIKEGRKVGICDTGICEIINLARQIRSVADQKMDDFVGKALNNGEGNISDATAEAQGCSPSAEEPKIKKEDASCC